MAPGKKTLSQRDLFIRRIRHEPADDLMREGPVDQESEGDRRRAVAAAKRRSIEGLRTKGATFPGSPDFCGWWWCVDPPDEAKWSDLLAALKILEEHGVDPSAYETAQLAYEHALTRIWANARPGYEELRNRLNKPIPGPADSLRMELLAKVDQHVQHARFFKPDSPGGRRGRPFENHALDHALEGARKRNWPHQVVSAILLLFRVDTSDWASLKEKVRKAAARIESQSRRQAAPTKLPDKKGPIRAIMSANAGQKGSKHPN